MQYKKSNALIYYEENGVFFGYNFLTKQSFETDVSSLGALADSQGWEQPNDESRPAYEDLSDLGILVKSNSRLHDLESAYEDDWKIGLPAALFHFSILDREYEDLTFNENLQRAKSKIEPSPQLFRRNLECERRVELQKPGSDPLIDIMARRRTVREVQSGVTNLSTLSDLLYCGLGVTGFTDNGICELPLKMVPSGGARNPYEAYVFVRQIEGLEPGIYHYSAVDHDLGQVAPLPDRSLGQYVGNQDWVDDKNALIVLVAYMERSTWKYEDPNIYRAILIEAGHIGQNMMLVATRDGQTLCPTAALAHSLIADAIGLENRVVHSPMYAMALGPVE